MSVFEITFRHRTLSDRLSVRSDILFFGQTKCLTKGVVIKE